MRILLNGLFLKFETKTRKTDNTTYGIVTFLVDDETFNAIVDPGDFPIIMQLKRMQQYEITCKIKIDKYTRIDFISAKEIQIK